ncbi:MAG: iron-containing alcohol dehydrogenase [Lachnospiraceae bacterium]
MVNQIAKCYRENGCDSLVAVGGGSVLDTAKGVRMLLSQKAEDIMELLGMRDFDEDAISPLRQFQRPPEPAPNLRWWR